MMSSPLMRSASVIAARSVQRPDVSAQMPSPGSASGVSRGLVTVMVMPRPAAARGRTMAGGAVGGHPAAGCREGGLQVEGIDAAVAVGVTGQHARGRADTAALAGLRPAGAGDIEVAAVDAPVGQQLADLCRWSPQGARRGCRHRCREAAPRAAHRERAGAAGAAAAGEGVAGRSARLSMATESAR